MVQNRNDCSIRWRSVGSIWWSDGPWYRCPIICIDCEVIVPVLYGVGGIITATTSAVGLGVVGSTVVAGGSIILSGGTAAITGIFGVAGAGLSGVVKQNLCLFQQDTRCPN